ncbi:hypothetical protein Q8G50_33010, partial [Klebsiella pneumoniae]
AAEALVAASAVPEPRGRRVPHGRVRSAAPAYWQVAAPAEARVRAGYPWEDPRKPSPMTTATLGPGKPDCKTDRMSSDLHFGQGP